MDPNKPTDPNASARPSSIDGFISPNQSSHQASQPAKPTHAAPSTNQRPFMPASFYKPPTLPTLPKLSDTPPPTHAEKTKKRQGLRDALSVAGVLASALLLAFVLINFVFQSYQVEGPSMRTTLEDADHLIVWKVDRTKANITGNTYIPNRGDVVIFSEPSGAEPGAQAGKQLIKRVVGLPGDRVVIGGTRLTIINDEHPNGFNPDETLPYGDKIIFEKPSSVDVVIGENEVFVLGDNRDNSLDSRAPSIGPVDADLIVGKLAVRILPLSNFKLF